MALSTVSRMMGACTATHRLERPLALGTSMATHSRPGKNSSLSSAKPWRLICLISCSSWSICVSVLGVKASSGACASRRWRCEWVISDKKILPLAEQCTGTREPGCR